LGIFWREGINTSPLNMSLERQAIIGLKWGATAKVLTQAVAWAVTLLVIRLLVPADYGLMALSAVVLSVVAGIAELGLGASVVQAAAVTRDDVARVQGALFLLNSACAAIVCLSAPLIAQAFGQPRLELVVQVSSVQLLFGAVAAIPEAFAYRDMRFRWLAATDIAGSVATSVTTLALAFSGAGVWALVVGGLIGQAIRTSLLVFSGVVVRPSFVLRGIGRFLRFGGAWSGARFAWQLTYQADVLIAGRFLTQEAVGIYSVAEQLANMPLDKLMGIVNQVAFPTIAKLQEQLPRMRRRILETVRMLAFAAIPLLWGVGAVAPEFVPVLLGARWQGIVLPLQLIAIVAPLRMLTTLFATTVSALGRSDVELGNTLLSLGVSVVAFLVGVRWEVLGLAVAYVAAVSISFVLNFPRTARIIGLSVGDVLVACRGPVVAGTIMLATIAVARLGLDTASQWLRLISLIALGAGAYTGIIALMDRAIYTDAQRIASALRKQA
jgi:O-antigen/teichoic acid export membrane protein